MQTLIVFTLLVFFATSQIVPPNPSAYKMRVSYKIPQTNGTQARAHLAIDRVNQRLSFISTTNGIGVSQTIIVSGNRYQVYLDYSTMKYTCQKDTVPAEQAKMYIENVDIIHTFYTRANYTGPAFVDCPVDKNVIPVNVFSFTQAGSNYYLMTCQGENRPKYIQVNVTPTQTVHNAVELYSEQVEESDFKLVGINPSSCQ